METASTPRGRTDAHAFRFIGLMLVALVIAAGAVLLLRPAGFSFSVSNGVRGSGVTATQTRVVPPFTRIDLAGVSTVEVHVGGKQTVVVHADDNLISRVTTDVRSGTLVIAERGNFSTRRPLSVDVTVPGLSGASLSGSGLVNIDGVHAREFTARDTGSGSLTVTGAVEQLDASLSGSGNVQLQDLAAHDVKATLAGSGRIQVQAARTLDASIPGHGQIVYGGHPTVVRQDVSGSGAVVEG